MTQLVGWLVEGFSKKGALRLGLFSVAPRGQDDFFQSTKHTFTLPAYISATDYQKDLCWLIM